MYVLFVSFFLLAITASIIPITAMTSSCLRTLKFSGFELIVLFEIQQLCFLFKNSLLIFIKITFLLQKIIIKRLNFTMAISLYCSVSTFSEDSGRCDC